MRNIGGKNWELQFDTDPKHKNKLAKECLKRHKIAPLEWTPYSLDLNLNENILRIMIGKLRKRNISAQLELVNQEWDKIDQVQTENK